MAILTGRNPRIHLLCSLLIVLATAFPVVSAQNIDEYEVKAAFLFNFTKFIEWPPIADPSSFSICILGDDPFGSVIDRVIKGKTAYGRVVQIRRLKEISRASPCQIVFVSSAEKEKAAKLADAVRGTGILTVGESDEFLRASGMVSLQMDDGRISLAINHILAETSGMKISANLLGLARIYKSGQGESR